MSNDYFIFHYEKTDFFNMYSILYKNQCIGFAFFDDDVSFYNNKKIFDDLVDLHFNNDFISFKLINKGRRLPYVKKENAKAY